MHSRHRGGGAPPLTKPLQAPLGCSDPGEVPRSLGEDRNSWECDLRPMGSGKWAGGEVTPTGAWRLSPDPIAEISVILQGNVGCEALLPVLLGHEDRR